MVRHGGRWAGVHLATALGFLLLVLPRGGGGEEIAEGRGASSSPCGAYIVENGDSIPREDARYPGSARISCHRGYRLSGKGYSVVHCTSSGKFSEGKRCDPVSCSGLSVTGGIVRPRGMVKYLGEVEISCSHGFELAGEGTSRRVCQHDGTFSWGQVCRPAERWVSLNAASARADIPSDLYVTGRGFDAGAHYECRFERRCFGTGAAAAAAENAAESHSACKAALEVTSGRVLSSTELECRSPVWTHGAGDVEMHVTKAGLRIPRVGGGGERVDGHEHDESSGASFRFYAPGESLDDGASTIIQGGNSGAATGGNRPGKANREEWTGMDSASGPATGGTILHLTGSHFRPEALYECVFTQFDEAAPGLERLAVSSRADVSSQSRMSCTVPPWPSAAPALVSVGVRRGGSDVVYFRGRSHANTYSFFEPELETVLAEEDQELELVQSGKVAQIEGGDASAISRAYDGGGGDAVSSMTEPWFDVEPVLRVAEDETTTAWPGFASNIAISRPDGSASPSEFEIFPLDEVSSSLFMPPGPMMSSDGTLLLQLAPHKAGKAMLSARIRCSGMDCGTANRSFQVVVVPQNDPPTFSMPKRHIELSEGAGDVNIAGFIKDISMGPAEEDELGQSGIFSLSPLTACTSGIFRRQPLISPSGDFSVSLVPGASGSCVFEAKLFDGEAYSAPVELTVTVLPVNDAPSFNLASVQVSVPHGVGRHERPGFATDISSGGGEDEGDQELTFVVQHVRGDASLFLPGKEPAISTDGTLDFQPAPGSSGSAEYRVSLRDSGGRERGGSDASADVPLVVSIMPAEAPGSARPMGDEAAGQERGESMGNSTARAGAGDDAVSMGRRRRLLSQDAPRGVAALGERLTASSSRRLLAAIFVLEVANVIVDEDDTASHVVASNISAGTSPSFGLASLRHRVMGAASFTTASAGSDTGGLFSSNPTIDAVTGELSMSDLAPDTFGTVEFDVVLSGSEGTSASQTLTITVESVNDAPSFTIANIVAGTVDLTTVPMEVDGVFNVYTIDGFTTDIYNGGVDESSQLLSFSWAQTSGEQGAISTVEVLCAAQPCLTANAVIRTIAGTSGAVGGLITIADSLGVSGVPVPVTFLVPKISTPPSFYTALTYPCDIRINADVCKKDLDVFENCECDSTYSWDEAVYTDITLARIAVPFADLEPCTQCTADSANRRTFRLEHFAIPSAGYAWEEAEQNITFTVTPVSASLSDTLFDVPPAIDPEGTLSFTLKRGRFGQVDFEVVLTDDGTGTASPPPDPLPSSPVYNMTVNVAYSNQPPTFIMHEVVVFESSRTDEVRVIPDALHTLTPGESINVNTGEDVESTQTVSFSTTAGSSGFFHSSPYVAGLNGTLILPIKQVVYGQASIPITLTDDASEGVVGFPSETKNLRLTIRPVNGRASFEISDVLTTSEDANCRRQLGWFTSLGDQSPSTPSGCMQMFHGAITNIRAGGDNEECSNCAPSIKVPCASADACRPQRISFVVDDVSDATLFHTIPSVSAEDGSISFTTFPDAAGESNVYMRIIDDFGTNEAPYASANPQVACDRVSQLPCGPGTGAATTREDTGFDTSQPVEFKIRILPVNDPPTITLKRDVRCLDARQGREMCVCPAQSDGLMSTPNCIDREEVEDEEQVIGPRNITTVHVLENAGPQFIDAFATDVSTSSAVAGGLSVFAFTNESDGSVRYRMRRKHPILGRVGLEMAVDYAMSPGQENVYTADFELASISVLDHSGGDGALKFIDRRGEAEDRLRFRISEEISTVNPCSAAGVNVGGGSWLGIGQGCLDVQSSKSHLPSEIRGDSLNESPAYYMEGKLWNHTVAFWDLSSDYAGGSLRRSLAGCNPSEYHETFISPSTIFERRANFPGATMWGMDDKSDELIGLFCLKARTFMDTKVGEQPNIFTFLANNGLAQGMQFDGKLNRQLYITNDLDEVREKFPNRAFSFESWFTIESWNTPQELQSTELGSSQGGLFSMYNGVENFPDEIKLRGLGITYQTRAPPATSIRMQMKMGVVGHEGQDIIQVTVDDFEYKTWHHMVWKYDGFDATFYLDGNLLQTVSVCVPDEFPTGCPVEVPRCDWDGKKCLYRYPENGQGHYLRANMVIGGNDVRDMRRNFYHYGMISTIKIYDVALKDQDVYDAFNATKARYGFGRPMRETYWSKALDGSNLLPSPSKARSQADAGGKLTLQGKFSLSRKYRCRWSSGDKHIVSETAAVTHGRFVRSEVNNTANVTMCASKVDMVQAEAICPNFQLICCDPDMTEQITCPMPSWPYGTRAASMSVIETASDEPESWITESYPIWQKTCLFADCGFVDVKEMLRARQGIDLGVEKAAVWWVGRNVTDVLISEIGDQPPHQFGFNRGDKTLFLWHSPSYLSLVDPATGAFSSTGTVALPMALGVASLHAVQGDEGDDPTLAIANFWNGRSSWVSSAVAKVRAGPIVELQQTFPTRGATDVKQISLPGHEEGEPPREYVAFSQYDGETQIFEKIGGRGDVQRVSIVEQGAGYVSGTLQIEGGAGSGFSGEFLSTPTGIIQPFVLPPDAGEILPFEAYGFTGGEMVCHDRDGCTLVVQRGENYTVSPQVGLDDLPLYSVVPNCTRPCDPVQFSYNCSNNDLSFCHQRPIIDSTVVPFYGPGCAEDDSGCLSTRMSYSITGVRVHDTDTLALLLDNSSAVRPGFSRGCAASGQIMAMAASNDTGAAQGFLARYDVGPNTNVASAAFMSAEGHGEGYELHPHSYLSDGDCRCGTTIVEARLTSPGLGYTSGRMSMVGGGGSGFAGKFTSRGNVTDIVFLEDDGAELKGAGYISSPKIGITTSSGGAGAEGFAVLTVSRIVVLSGGSNITAPLTVNISAPFEDQGVQNAPSAIARAVMGPPDENGTIQLVEVVIEYGGLGFTAVPLVQFGKGEADKNRTVELPVAIPIMSIAHIDTNHFEQHLPVNTLTTSRYQMLSNNMDWWFDGKQNDMYVQPLDTASDELTGVDMTIDKMLVSSLSSDTEIVIEMLQVCENCTFVDSTGEYLVEANLTEVVLPPPFFNTTTNTTVNATPPDPLRYQAIPRRYWASSPNGQFQPDKNKTSWNNLTEGECLEICLREPDCFGVDVGLDHASGQCWIKTLPSTRDTSSDQLWWDLAVVPTEPSTPNTKGAMQRGCTDLPGWRDSMNRTCADYNASMLCSLSDPFPGPQFFYNITNHTDNTTYLSDPTNHSVWYGPGWTDNITFFADFAVNGIGADSACCACGRTPPNFKAFAKSHPTLSVKVEQPEELLCRPLDARLAPGSSPTALCNPPLSIQTSASGADRCCMNMETGYLTLGIGSEAPFSDTLRIIGGNLSSGTILADGLRVAIPSEIGQSGQEISVDYFRPASARAIVTGGILSIEQTKRGEGYTSDGTIVWQPRDLPQNHDPSYWGDLTEPYNLYTFDKAIAEFDVGFSGSIPGAFDGTLLDNLCTQDQHDAGLCSREMPYGSDYGACISLVRAHGADLVASAAIYDLVPSHITSLPTKGATGLVSFQIDGQTYLAVSNHFDAAGIDFSTSENYAPPETVMSGSMSDRNEVVSQLFSLSVSHRGRLEATLVQTFDTVAARDVEYFESNGTAYLMFAQQDKAYSMLYRWSTNMSRFELQHAVPTQGARQLNAFSPPNSTDIYVFLAQVEDALTCSLRERLSTEPTCDAQGGSGEQGLGPVLTEELAAGQSAMLRWNGTMLLGVTTPETLPKDLSGGQVFESQGASGFAYFEQTDGAGKAMLLSGQSKWFCEDDPDWLSPSGHACPAYAGELQASCHSSGAYRCDACPRSCGTCDMCKGFVDNYEANGTASACKDQEDISRWDVRNGFGTLLTTCTQCFDSIQTNCLACAKTCGICGACQEHILGRQGKNYGTTQNIAKSALMSAGAEQLKGLEGVSSVVVSPDGNNVYASSFLSRSLVAFDRNQVTGRLRFRADKSILTDSIPNGGSTADCDTQDSPECTDTGYGRPMQGLSQIAISSEGKDIYGVSTLSAALHRFSRDVSTGVVTLVDTIHDGTTHGGVVVDGLAGASGLSISPNGLSVYIASYTDQAVAAFSRNPANGELTFVDRIKNGERVFSTWPRRVGDGSGQYPRQLVEGNIKAVRLFVIGAEQLMAVAIGQDTLAQSDGQLTVSLVDQAGAVRVIQDLSAGNEGASSVEHFFILDDFGAHNHYLAVSNSFDNADNGVRVYRWNTAARQFIFFQRLNLAGDADVGLVRSMRYFEMSGEHFLAVAIYMKAAPAEGTPPDTDVDSIVYMWNQDGRTTLQDGSQTWGIGFEPFQRIPTHGAVSFDHIEVDGTHFLAVANFASGTSTRVASEIFVYRPGRANPDPPKSFTSGRGGFFDSVYQFDSVGAHHVIGFAIPGGGTFFAFAERMDGSVHSDAAGTPQYAGGGVSVHAYNASSQGGAANSALWYLSQRIDGSEGIGMSVPHEEPAYPTAPSCGQTEAGKMCGVDSLVGATTLRHVPSGGEHYLAIGQSQCSDYFGGECTLDGDRQPQSALLQWHRGTSTFTEMLSITDATAMNLRGSKPRPIELLFHSYALRIPAGIVSSWSNVELPSSRPGIHNVSLLLAASRNMGLVAYELEWQVITGLNGTSEVLSLLPNTTYSPLFQADYTRPDFEPASFTNWSTTPTLMLSPEQEASSDGEHVYAASQMDRSLVILKRAPVFDLVGRRISELSFPHLVLAESPKQRPPSPSSSGIVIPSAAPTNILSVPEGALSRPVGIELFNEPSVDVNGTVSYTPRIAVRMQQAADERQCTGIPYDGCSELTFEFEFVAGNSRLLLSPPKIAPNGTLMFNSRPFQVGVTTWAVRPVDSSGGDAALGGGNASGWGHIQIVVDPVNQAPSFQSMNVYANYKQGRQELIFATNVTPGGTTRYSELEQVQEASLLTFDFRYIVDNEEMFAYEEGTREATRRDANGTLETFTETYAVVDGRPKLRVVVFDDRMVGVISFETKESEYGQCNITAMLYDSGPVSEVTGSQNSSEYQTFSLTIRPINIKPSFSLVVPEIKVLAGLASDDVYTDTFMVSALPPSPGAPVPPYPHSGPLGPGGEIPFTVLPVTNGTVCDVPPSEEGATQCQMTEVPLTMQSCIASKSCPDESTQVLSYHVVGARKVHGNWPGPDADILRDGAGLFRPPTFTATCDVDEMDTYRTDFLIIYGREWNADLAGTIVMSPERRAHVNQSLQSLEHSQTPVGRSITVQPDRDFGVPHAKRDIGAEMRSAFCSDCELGWCDGGMFFPPYLIRGCVSDFFREDRNCEGTCINPVCTTRLDVYTPIFSELGAQDASGEYLFGWMDFQTLPGASGQVSLQVAAVDTGGRLNGGSDISTKELLLTIVGVNRPPIFHIAKAIEVPEARTAFPQSFPSLLNVTGGLNEDQEVSFEISAVDDRTGIFLTDPEDAAPMVSLGPDRTLDFTLTPYANGVGKVTIVARDAFGTEYGGDDEADPYVIDIVVIPVNDPPTASLRPEVYAVEDAGDVSVPLFATNMSKGPPDEAWQTVSFSVASIPRGLSPLGAQDASTIFPPGACEPEPCGDEPRNTTSCSSRWLRGDSIDLQPLPVESQFGPPRRPCGGSMPKIDADGTLTFRSGRDQHGVVALLVGISDDGGDAYGGIDRLVGGDAGVVIKILPQPRVSSVSPRIGGIRSNAAEAAGAATITITGQYFGSLYSRGYQADAYPMAGVLVGGVPCTQHTFISDTTLECVPAPTIGSAAIEVVIHESSSSRYFAPGSPTTRRGALPASRGYTQFSIVFGGSLLPADPSEGDPGFVMLGPDSNAPGNAQAPSSSAQSAGIVLPQAASVVKTHQGRVYVAGGFTSVDDGSGQRTLNRIFTYDGASALPVGSGTNGDVYCMHSFGSLLAVGGAFTEAYSSDGLVVTTGGIAFWNHASQGWEGGGTRSLQGVVMALASAPGSPWIFAGGRFDRYGQESTGINGIGALGPDGWVRLGDGISGGHVRAIAVGGCTQQHDPSSSSSSSSCHPEHTVVYAGGTFQTAGGVPVRGVARWSGGRWEDIGGLDGTVYAILVTSGGGVYFGGGFTEVHPNDGSAPFVSDHLVRWTPPLSIDNASSSSSTTTASWSPGGGDGGKWEPVGAGVGGVVHALEEVMGCLYIGGAFDRACENVPGLAPATRCAAEEDERVVTLANGAARRCNAPTRQAPLPTTCPSTSASGSNSSNASSIHTDVDGQGGTCGLGETWEAVAARGVGKVAKVRSIATFVET